MLTDEEFALSFWFKPELETLAQHSTQTTLVRFTSSNRVTLCCADTYSYSVMLEPTGQLHIEAVHTLLLTGQSNEEGNRKATPDIILSESRWYHLSINFHRYSAQKESASTIGRQQIYLDGELKAELDWTPIAPFTNADESTPGQLNTQVHFGGVSTPLDTSYLSLDEVAMFSRQLTADEISTLMNEGMAVTEPVSAGQVYNLSARAWVGNGDNALIAGFIIEKQPQRILIQTNGPSLSNYGITQALLNPILLLYKDQEVLLVNDNWQQGSNTTQAIQDLNMTPEHANDASILLELEPGAYTAMVLGNGSVGNALVSVVNVTGR